MGDKKDDLPPPPPPKRSNQTAQKLKKLSRIIKYTIPSKMPSPLSSKKSSTGKAERRSLKDKMMDNDLTNFLKERRAVSESRFKSLEKGQSPSPTGLIERTKSDPDFQGSNAEMERTDLIGRDAWGITPGNAKNLVDHFERQASPQPDVSPTRSLKSPTREQQLKSPELVNRVEKSKSPSPQRNTVKAFVDPAPPEPEPDKQSTTSPESGMDDNNKSETESKKGSKKSRKDKKDRRRHSGCEACNSDREHKEHKKDRKRVKKAEQQKRK